MNCPRCKAQLPITGVGNELSCTAGCGTWLPQPLVEALVGADQLAYLGQFDDAATPMIGIRNEQGIWLERASRADFERAFAPAITRHSGIEELVAALRAGDDASLRKVATRIVLLEERVRDIAARRRG